jgi:hypothetical protein
LRLGRRLLLLPLGLPLSALLLARLVALLALGLLLLLPLLLALRAALRLLVLLLLFGLLLRLPLAPLGGLRRRRDAGAEEAHAQGERQGGTGWVSAHGAILLV